MTDKGKNILSDISEDDPSHDTSEGSECSVAPDGVSDVPANPPDGMNDQRDHAPHVYGTPAKRRKVIESSHINEQEPDEDRGGSDGSGGSGSSASVHNDESIPANRLEVRFL